MSQRRIEAFLLRLIVEDEHIRNTNDWRGRIQHVASGHERQFANVQDLLAFIHEQFGTEALPMPSDGAIAAQQHGHSPIV